MNDRKKKVTFGKNVRRVESSFLAPVEWGLLGDPFIAVSGEESSSKENALNATMKLNKRGISKVESSRSDETDVRDKIPRTNMRKKRTRPPLLTISENTHKNKLVQEPTNESQIESSQIGLFEESEVAVVAQENVKISAPNLDNNADIEGEIIRDSAQKAGDKNNVYDNDQNTLSTPKKIVYRRRSRSHTKLKEVSAAAEEDFKKLADSIQVDGQKVSNGLAFVPIEVASKYTLSDMKRAVETKVKGTRNPS